LAGIAATVEAFELVEATEPVNGVRIVSRVFEDRDIEELNLLARRLVDGDSVVALLASKESGMARLIFARSANLSTDMSVMMRAACERLGGRGGGKPDFANGGGSKLSELDEALKEARAIFKV
jgi:alanyl-tRNA synthetase